MVQDRKERLSVRRERDLEKRYRPQFEEYEKWKALQGEEPVVEALSTEEKPKKGFTKFDFIFLGLGFLVAMIWRGCKKS